MYCEGTDQKAVGVEIFVVYLMPGSKYRYTLIPMK